MARINYLISGLPGTGKTSVCTELQARGYRAIDADRAFGYQNGAEWLWDEKKIEKVVDDQQHAAVFICGSASNREKYIAKFAKVFILYVDDHTLERRLTTRINNNFGKDPATLARQIKHNQGVREYSLKRGRVVIDATQPLGKVMDDILGERVDDL